MTRPASSLLLALQLLRLHLQWPRAKMARAAGLCPCCYRAFELGTAAIPPRCQDRLLTVWPFLADVVSELPTEMRLPPSARRLKNQIERILSLDPSRQPIELARLRLALQWLDETADVDAHP